jgi:hypothetical protein
MTALRKLHLGCYGSQQWPNCFQVLWEHNPMANLIPSVSRREFIGSAIITAVGGLLADLTDASRIFSQTCNQLIPGDTEVPSTYQLEPRLLALRADALLQQIKRGYGYYGQPRNWTTLWSLDEMSSTLDTILNNELSVSNALSNLACSADDLVGKIESYDQAINAAQQVQESLKRTLDDDNSKAAALLTVINDLASDIQTQRSIVDPAQANFDNAVIAAACGGCNFGELLGIVAAVIGVVAAAVTAGTSIVAAYSALGTLATNGIGTAAAGATALQELEKAYNDVKPVVTKVITATKDVNDLLAKYRTLTTDLNRNADSARVLVEQTSFNTVSAAKIKDFDNTVNNASGVSQTIKDQLINAVHIYFDLEQLRNKKIDDHDGLIVNIQDSARSYFEQGVQIASLSDMKSVLASTNQVPQKVAYVNALNSIQDAQLTVMKQLVWDEKRAQAFFQLNRDLLNASSLVEISSIPTAAELLQAHNGIKTQQARFSANQSQPVTPFDSAGIAVKLPLSDSDRKSLVSTRRFRFTLAPEDGHFPSHMREIFIVGFKVAMEPTSPRFSGTLVHLGRHQFQTVSGDSVEFASQPIPIGIQSGEMSDFVSALGATGNQIHGMSAFGDWAITADPNVPMNILRRLQSITVTFQGNSRASAA